MFVNNTLVEKRTEQVACTHIHDDLSKNYEPIKTLNLIRCG